MVEARAGKHVRANGMARAVESKKKAKGWATSRRAQYMDSMAGRRSLGELRLKPSLRQGERTRLSDPRARACVCVRASVCVCVRVCARGEAERAIMYCPSASARPPLINASLFCETQ